MRDVIIEDVHDHVHAHTHSTTVLVDGLDCKSCCAFAHFTNPSLRSRACAASRCSGVVSAWRRSLALLSFTWGCVRGGSPRMLLRRGSVRSAASRGDRTSALRLTSTLS